MQGAAIADDIAELGRALFFVLHAPRDAVVGIDNATRIFTAARHPKSFVTLDDADHLISRGRDAEYAAGVIASWAQRYLDLRPPAPAARRAGKASRASPRPIPAVSCRTSWRGRGTTCWATSRKAMAARTGGSRSYQFLAAGLGACTSMTLRMYARRKRWPLTHVSVGRHP